MKIAVLSNINMDSIENHLKLPDLKQFYSCGYNQYIQDLINPDSQLYKLPSDYIFIHLEGEELLKEDFYSIEKENTLRNFELLLESIQKYLVHHPDITIIISEIVLPPFSFTTYIKYDSETNSLSLLEDMINQRLHQFSRDYNNILILDFKRLIKLHGYNHLTDDKYWYLGRIKYSFDGFKILADEIRNIITAHLGKINKVLILDLDNTLWGGILGEDGADGIQLSEEGTGKCYRDFQKAIKSVGQLGVLLAICSKNNPNDADIVFKSHSMMILKDSDFIIKKINWKNKVENIIEISNEINLGLDSFVFIDDNPFERGLVAEKLSQVSVPEFPRDVSKLKKWFLSEIIYQYFPKLHLTNEDKGKSLQYSRNIKRGSLQKSLNIDDFIKSLDIKLTILNNPDHIIPRLAQLTQKTNQFNLTTRRYVEKDIERFIQSPDYHVHALSYKDKFGDEGIIGEIIYKIADNRAIIDIFLLSCRVIGRNVEFSFLKSSLEKLSKSGITGIEAEYIPTQKNILVKNLYPESGLTKKSGNSYSAGVDMVIETLAKRFTLSTLWVE